MTTVAKTHTRVGAHAVVAIAVLFLGPSAPAAERFVEQAAPAHGPAHWLSLHADRIAIGAGESFHVGTAGPAVRAGERLRLTRPVDHAVLVAERLFTLAPDGIHSIRYAGETPADELAMALPLSGRGARLTRMDDYLVVATNGEGLSLFLLPHAGHGEHGLTPAGQLRLEADVAAVGSSFRRIYVATEDGRLLLVDARDPAAPTVAGEADLGGAARAVAGRGALAFVARADRLATVEFRADGTASIVDEQPAPGISALQVAGRTLYAAAGDDGVVVLRDATEGGIIVPVTVGDNFFQPSGVSIDAGDTVRWEKTNFGLHNVESCDGVGTDPPFCGGEVSPDGSWSSGGPTSSPFAFAHTFANAGSHPYVCVVHTGLGMNGVVTVADAAPAPPVVPEGIAGAPVLVSKLDPAGDVLSVTWDDTTCPDSTDHRIVYGRGQDLPATLGGTYGVAGGACDIGATAPFEWSSPDTAIDAGGLVWFLVVADDGAAAEGAWGDDAAGAERAGPGADGSSGVCGATTKDVSNACGS